MIEVNQMRAPTAGSGPRASASACCVRRPTGPGYPLLFACAARLGRPPLRVDPAVLFLLEDPQADVTLE
jgi:hypothetical protein